MSLNALRSYVNQSTKDRFNSHGFRALSSFDMLENIDLMIAHYQLENPQDQGGILLNVFGLLQGLFVAIDALYDLALGLTKYKYHININQNPVLHELKYIRNDIVGHPTHRTYPDGGIGFSLLVQDSITKDKFSYKTYIYEKNQVEEKHKDVYLHQIIDAYQKESRIILKEILNYLQHEESETELPEKIFVLFETLNIDLLHEIKQDFIKTYDVDVTSSNRFLWRIELLDLLIHWHEDDREIGEFILYMSRFQTTKLYDIALNLEKRKGKELYAPIPDLLHAFYKFIAHHEKVALPLLENIHDYNHPFYKRHLLSLMALSPSRDASKLLSFLKAQTDEKKVYLIGSILRSYRPKK